MLTLNHQQLQYLNESIDWDLIRIETQKDKIVIFIGQETVDANKQEPLFLKLVLPNDFCTDSKNWNYV
jgi:hypothetical protein